VQAWCSATWAKNSGTGVGFTRNPATGEHVFFGEYLMNAQGRRCRQRHSARPLPISELEKTMPHCLPASA